MPFFNIRSNQFLCVKLIIFASYWQGFFLSILVWLGVIHDVGYYTPDNIARAIQDVLICFELPGFAIAHWYAFSWKDYADRSISAARLPVYYAFRDAFGIRDLIEDTKQTFAGKGYEYRLFDPSDNVIAHPESGARVARMMDGLRYERGGKGKYWIPKPTSRTGLLNSPGPSGRESPMSPGEAERGPNRWRGADYGAMEEVEIDEDDEKLYSHARALEYGDYNVGLFYVFARIIEIITNGRFSILLSPRMSPGKTTVAVITGRQCPQLRLTKPSSAPS